MSSFLLFQQCPACLVRQTLIVFVMGGWWLYSCCFVGCWPLDFFLAAVVSKLLYRCTTWTLTKRIEEKLDGNYTRMLRAILNNSWRQHPTKHQLYGQQTYIQQLCEDTECSPEDQPEAMNNREKWRERVRDIRAGGMTWWWWWYIYMSSWCNG